MGILKSNKTGYSRLWLGGALAVLMLLSLSLATLPAQADDSATLQATDTRSGQSPTISGSGFEAGERIDLWLTTPDGMASGFGYTYADGTGGFSGYTDYPTVNDDDSSDVKAAKEVATAGQWYVTARGTTSNRSVIAGFQVVNATLTASVRTVYGSEVVVAFNGSYFYPNEKISMWITDSNGTVIPVSYCWADGNGNIPALDSTSTSDDSYKTHNTVTFTATTGSYYLTAHGNTSGQNVYTKVSN